MQLPLIKEKNIINFQRLSDLRLWQTLLLKIQCSIMLLQLPGEGGYSGFQVAGMIEGFIWV